MKFINILEKMSDGHKWTYSTEEEFNQKFDEWAAAWDCKEAETDGQNSPMIGDEIEVGTLWEDKSQKDFKSYL